MTVRAETGFDTGRSDRLSDIFRPASASSHPGLTALLSVLRSVRSILFRSIRRLSCSASMVALRACLGRERARGYAVNVLAENQKDVADRFAKSRSKKWEGVTYSAGFLDAPVLPGVAAVLECAAWARHEGGDHLLFIAEVKRFRIFPTGARLFSARGDTPNFAKLSSLLHSGRSTSTTKGVRSCSRQDQTTSTRSRMDGKSLSMVRWSRTSPSTPLFVEPSSRLEPCSTLRRGLTTRT